MAIGRITGSVLKSNLTRNGVDLAFETNLLYLDVTNSRVGIGTSEPSSELHVNGTVTASAITGLSSATITNTSTDDSILVTTTENSSSAGPVITLKRNSASPADADYMGQIKFKGENDADQEVIYAKITGKIQDASDGSEDGIIEFANRKAGSNTITARLRSDSLQLLNGTSLTVAGDTTITGSLTADGLSYPTADGSNGQVLTTDGSGNLSFSESSGGGGGNNTAVKQFNYYKLNTTSAVIDEFDVTEYRGAIYDVIMEDQDNGFVGHLKVSVVHNDSTPYVSVYNINEDSTRIADFSVAISGDMLQLSAVTNTSKHTNLRIYRIALGDHHETVANTNSKIISTTTNIGSSATTLDQFTKTDIRGAKYVILIKDDTAGDYQISEASVTHDGTTVYHTDYALVSSRGTPLHTFSASISGATVTVSSTSGGNTTGTAILYRQDLGSKTKLGEFDNFLYGVKGDIDSAVETVDTFDVFKYKAARYFITLESGSEYQNSEVTMTVNDAGTDATISESFLITGNNTLATFTADVSNGKARLRASCNPNTKIYFARLAIEAENIYRASGQTSDDIYITHNNITANDTQLILSGMTGALTLPSGTTGQQPTGVGGMIRYNSSTGAYEKYDTSSSAFVDITTTASTSSSDDAEVPTPATALGTTQGTIDQFTTSAADSVFYYAVTRDEINGEVSTARYSVVHNDTNAFVTQSHMVESGDGTNDHISVDADINSGNVRLLATGASVVNSVSLYKISLGDSTTAATTGNVSTIINSDVDSATENLDTWAHASYRGAKYFISVNSGDNTELSNLEALVVHNGSDAFITIYNEHYTGNNSLITLSADISGSNVRLRGAGLTPNLRVTMYRILLSDSESASTGDNVNVVAATNVSSTAATVDTFSSDSYTGAFYVLVGNNTSEGAASIQEVMVVQDGSDAYVGAGPIVSTKGTDQLQFTASLSGTTVSLKASSTSGSSTTVNAYRVHLLRGEAGAATSNTVLIDTDQTITGQKTFSSEVILNSISSSDSSAVTINDNLKVTGLSTTNAFLINAGSGTIGETTTLTVDPASNYLGINQTSPEVTLHMTGEGAQSAQIRMEQHNDTADAPDVRTRKSRGTAAAPSDNNAGDFLFRINAEAYQTNTYNTMGSIQIDLDDSDNTASTFQIQTHDGTSLADRLTINGSGNAIFSGSVQGKGFTEDINALTSSSTITVNCDLARVHTVTLGTNTEFNITNLPTGGTVTLIITQDGTGSRTATFGTDGSSAVRFPSGSSVLSTGANDIDVVSIFNDGTNFLGNIARNYS